MKSKCLLLGVLGLVLEVSTLVMGVNEATKDAWDPIGSNYWLAYSAIASGTSLL